MVKLLLIVNLISLIALIDVDLINSIASLIVKRIDSSESTFTAPAFTHKQSYRNDGDNRDNNSVFYHALTFFNQNTLQASFEFSDLSEQENTSVNY